RPGGRPAHPARTTRSTPTTAAPASTCSAGTAGVTRRTFSPSGAGHERDRRIQAGIGAVAIPDRRAVRRAGRARSVRRDHLTPAGPGRLRAVPGLAERHAPGRRRAALRADLRPTPPKRAVPALLPLRRYPQARPGHAGLQDRL